MKEVKISLRKYLGKKNISITKFFLKKKAHKFYESYHRLKKNKLPIIDVKLALSKDYFTINKKKNGLQMSNHVSCHIF